MSAARIAGELSHVRSRASAFLLLVLALGLVFGGTPAQARPAGSARAQAFLLTSAPDSLADLKRHAKSIAVVYPTYFDCQLGSGRVLGRAQPQVTGYARSRGLRVMPRFNCQDGATVHEILTVPSLRRATLARLMSIATAAGVSGISLDLENDGAEDRTAMSAFVLALAADLHARGRRLSVVVVGVNGDDPRRSTGFYDDRAIGAAADSVFVLAWGTHWAGSGPGPIAPLPFVQEVVDYVASLPSASRFVIGSPMYGLDWPLGAEAAGAAKPVASAYQYADVVALAHSVGAHPRRDPISQELSFRYTTASGVSHEVWYMDGHTVAAVLRLGRAAGLGVGLWRLGLEDQSLWSSQPLKG